MMFCLLSKARPNAKTLITRDVRGDGEAEEIAFLLHFSEWEIPDESVRQQRFGFGKCGSSSQRHCCGVLCMCPVSLQRLVVCLEESIYIHNIKDMKLLKTIMDTPLNTTGERGRAV